MIQHVFNSYAFKNYYLFFQIEHLFKDVPLANIDIEEKYVKVLVAYDDAQKVAQEEEIKTFKLVSTLEEKKESVSIHSLMHETLSHLGQLLTVVKFYSLYR